MTPGVSRLHSHPWDFESIVVAGHFTNIVWEENSFDLAPRTHYGATIKCGEGGGIVSEPELVSLDSDQPFVMTPGHEYTQSADWIHETYAADGSVTLCTRRVTEGDGEHARVFWKPTDGFVSAEPRRATADEVEAACTHALAAWF
jgi:hypothetical protein